MAAAGSLADGWAALQDALFTSLMHPLLLALGLANLLEDGYAAAQELLVGLAQVMAMICLLEPLERLFPFEPRPADEQVLRERRQAVRVDVVYTLIERLGLMRLALFFAVDPLWNALFGWLTVTGADGWHLDQLLAPLWPGVSDTALFGFIAYAVVLDGIGYVVHRAQHHFEWWWALHAVHHSQRHMTLWTDSRNHLLDALLMDCIFVLVARVIGVPPMQFVVLMALSKLIESLAHANTTLSFGRIGERLLVGPAFHRVHHGIGVGHEAPGGTRLGGCNFSVLLPVWDLMFGTARYGVPPGPTGIRDQLPHKGGRDYGRGFWAQQRLGFARCWRVLRWGGKRCFDLASKSLFSFARSSVV